MEAARFQRAQVAQEGGGKGAEEPSSSLFRLHARCTPFFFLHPLPAPPPIRSPFKRPMQYSAALGRVTRVRGGRRLVGVAGGQFPLSLAKKKKEEEEEGRRVKKNRKREPRGPRSLRPSNWRRCPSEPCRKRRSTLSLSLARQETLSICVVSFLRAFPRRPYSIARNLLIPFFVFFGKQFAWKLIRVSILLGFSFRLMLYYKEEKKGWNERLNVWLKMTNVLFF